MKKIKIKYCKSSHTTKNLGRQSNGKQKNTVSTGFHLDNSKQDRKWENGWKMTQ